jgi:hypothetical protein
MHVSRPTPPRVEQELGRPSVRRLRRFASAPSAASSALSDEWGAVFEAPPTARHPQLCEVGEAAVGTGSGASPSSPPTPVGSFAAPPATFAPPPDSAPPSPGGLCPATPPPESSPPDGFGAPPSPPLPAGEPPSGSPPCPPSAGTPPAPAAPPSPVSIGGGQPSSGNGPGATPAPPPVTVRTLVPTRRTGVPNVFSSSDDRSNTRLEELAATVACQAFFMSRKANGCAGSAADTQYLLPR